MIAAPNVKSRIKLGGSMVLALLFAASMRLPSPAQQNVAPPELPSFPGDFQRAAHFSGRVTDLDGQPVPGARLFIVPNKGPSTVGLWEGGTALINPIPAIGPVRATTDAEGRFAFDAPDMAYMAVDGFANRHQGLLVATAEARAADWMITWGNDSESGSHWDPSMSAPLDFKLGPIGPPINGRFLNPAGQPLADARVRLVRLMIPEDRDLDEHLAHEIRGYGMFSGADYDRESDQPDLIPGLTAETRTDADGRFTLSGLGRDWLAVLQVSEPSVQDASMSVMTRDAPNFEIKRDRGSFATPRVVYGARFTRQLELGRTVAGRVVDRDSGEPIPGMWVGPRENYYAGVSAQLYPWRTDADGRFTITGLPLTPSKEGDVVMAVSPPGVPYQMAGEYVVGNKEVLIECPRGIPFRLKVVDDRGMPVEAEVTYVTLYPNPHVEVLVPRPELRYHWPNAPAAHRADGTYEGFVLPGPGALLVKTPRSAGYRPACVDPKAYFAPGRTDWPDDQQWAYGTLDSLATEQSHDQIAYAAILLVNTAQGAKELERTATVVPDVPRQVNLIDAAGQPVEIEQYRGSTRRLTASFPLNWLHPDRPRPLVYLNEDRQLIGLLMARGDGDSPYTVRMQPWATITGRVIDEHGHALSGAIVAVNSDDPTEAERHLGATTDDTGRFAIPKLVPGHRYSGKILYGRHVMHGDILLPLAGIAFTDLVLKEGETHNLGDVPTVPPTYEEFPLTYDSTP